MSSDDLNIFIPCEICDEPIMGADYYSHVSICNSRHAIRNYTAAQYAINPLLNIFIPRITNEIDSSPELSSNNGEDDDDEPEGEDNGEINEDIIPGNNSNLTIRFFSSLLGESGELQRQESLGFQDIMPGIYNILNSILSQPDLEDVMVGLTPEQKLKCLTEKEKPIEKKEPDCQICYDEDMPEKITELICGHQMCKKCADTHFASHVKCPFCNQDLRDILEAKENSKKETETENIAG